jgi:four helix bundle protein
MVACNYLRRMTIKHETPAFSSDEPGKDSFLYSRSLELGEECVTLVQRFPVEERFNLVDQVLRATVLVSSNIAGANESDTRKRRLRHLDIARGKLKRLEALLAIAKRVGYIDRDSMSRARLLYNELDGILKTLIKQLASQTWD